MGFDFGVNVFGPLLPQVQTDFGISAESVALALSVYHGVRLLINVPAGRSIARVALPQALAAGGVILALGAIVVAVAPVFPVVLAGRALMGMGSAIFYITVQLWISRVATSDNKAQLFSYQQVASLTGGALGPAVGGAVAGLLSWRFSLVLAVVAGLAAVVMSRWIADPAPERHAPPTAGVESPAGPMQLHEVLGPGMGMLGNFFFYGAMSVTVIPLFAAQVIHLGPGAIGGVLMLGTLQRFGAALVGARLIRIIGTRWTVLWSQVALAFCVLTFIVIGSPLGLIVAVSLVSWANIGGSFIVALVTDIIPEAHWGTALGFNRTMGDIGAVTAPLLVGWLIDHYGFNASFIVTAGVLLLTAGAAAVLIGRGTRRRTERESAKLDPPKDPLDQPAGK
jgi:predicted MFS family arabinose efflux permease